jgi:Polyphosphate kinase 2 (PPK2)
MPRGENHEPKRRPKLSRSTYQDELKRLQFELVRLQYWVMERGQRIVVIFEGRDAAGKGSTIKRSHYLISRMPACPSERSNSGQARKKPQYSSSVQKPMTWAGGPRSAGSTSGSARLDDGPHPGHAEGQTGGSSTPKPKTPKPRALADDEYHRPPRAAHPIIPDYDAQQP